MDERDRIHNEKTLVKLLKEIKAQIINHKEDIYPFMLTYSDIAILFNIHQNLCIYLVGYRNKSMADANVLENMGVHIEVGLVHLDVGRLDMQYSSTRDATTEYQANVSETKADNKLLIIAFTKASNLSQFIDIARNLENILLNKFYKYPINLMRAYNMLSNCIATKH